MPNRDDDLPFGPYERLITASLKARLLQFDPAATMVSTKGLDPVEANATLARHVEDVVARALRGILQEDRLAKQAEVANEIIGLLSGPAEARRDSDTDPIEVPPEQLRSIQAITGTPASDES